MESGVVPAKSGGRCRRFMALTGGVGARLLYNDKPKPRDRTYKKIFDRMAIMTTTLMKTPVCSGICSVTLDLREA